MNKVIDLYDRDNITNIFDYFNRLYPEHELFKHHFTVMDLNTGYYLFHSPNKTLSKYVSRMKEIYSDSYKQYMYTSIINKFVDKWNKILVALYTDYAPLENYRMIESGNNQETFTGTNSTTNNTTQTQKQSTDVTTSTTVDNSIYGFNSSSATPQSTGDSSVHSSGSLNDNVISNDLLNETNESMDHDNITQHTLTRSGNIGVTTSQQMLESELKLREYDVLTTIYNDIDSMLCLKIY